MGTNGAYQTLSFYCFLLHVARVYDVRILDLTCPYNFHSPMAGLPIPKQSKSVCKLKKNHVMSIKFFLPFKDEKYLTSKHLLQNLRVNIMTMNNYCAEFDCTIDL